MAPVQEVLDLGEVTTHNSLHLPDDLATHPAGYDQFAELVARVHQLHDSSTWWIGDLVHEGKRLFGDESIQALPHTVSEKTLLNRARVCELFPLKRRKFAVSFSHYAEIVSLTLGDQNRLLKRSETQKLTVSALRQLVRELKAKNRGEQDELDIDDPIPTYANALRVVVEMDPIQALGLAESPNELVRWCRNTTDAYESEDWPQAAAG